MGIYKHIRNGSDDLNRAQSFHFIIPGMSWLLESWNVYQEIGGLSEKVFGDLAYDLTLSEYKDNYCVHTLLDSIKATEETE